jgi:hypothetical protein
MLRNVASRVAWVGRTASMVFGLALVLALIFGALSVAVAHTGSAGLFHLNHNNLTTALTTLTGNVNGSALQVVNTNAGTNDTALNLSVQSGEAPMRVNSQTRVANLNAALAGQADSAASAAFASNAANSDKLDGKDSSELPGTVVQTKAITGNTSDAETFGTLVFVTIPVTMTTTSSTQQLVGVVSAPLKTDTNIVVMNYGLCYRQAGTTNPLVLFYGGNETVQAAVTTTTQTWTTAQTKVVGLAGSWDVGFCAQNSSNNAATLEGDGKASGWIEVVNPTP